MVRSLSPDPVDRMGVYKRFGDVPDRRRLKHHAAVYEGRDVWEEYLHDHLFPQYDSERFVEDVHRAGDRWKVHMADRGGHHALATPEDVEAWAETLVERLKIKTAYNSYWVKIADLYDWLRWHTDHPHVYDPFLMAAAEHPASGEIWAEKIRRGRGDSA